MPNLVKDCSGVILAGGENRRMPVLKAFIKINGDKIIEKNLKILKKIFKEIFIVTNQPEMYVYLGVPLLGDVYNVRGPMTGLFSSLLNSSNQWVFLSACDMPFINEHLIRYMAAKRDYYDAVVPKSPIPPENPPISPFNKGGRRGGYTEPLFAFYSKRLVQYVEGSLISGKTGLKNFLNNKRVNYIHTREIKNIDTDARSFININTPEDVQFYLRTESYKKSSSNHGKKARHGFSS